MPCYGQPSQVQHMPKAKEGGRREDISGQEAVGLFATVLKHTRLRSHTIRGKFMNRVKPLFRPGKIMSNFNIGPVQLVGFSYWFDRLCHRPNNQPNQPTWKETWNLNTSSLFKYLICFLLFFLPSVQHLLWWTVESAQRSVQVRSRGKFHRSISFIISYSLSAFCNVSLNMIEYRINSISHESQRIHAKTLNQGCSNPPTPQPTVLCLFQSSPLLDWQWLLSSVRSD